jgi:hypothetical protein
MTPCIVTHYVVPQLAVIPRESGAIQYVAASRFNSALEYLDHPLSRMMTTEGIDEP